MEQETNLMPEKRNWLTYWMDVLEFKKSGEPDQVEDLLMEDHPIMVGEEYVFEWLENALHEKYGPDRSSRVMLDETGKHVVPK